MEKRFLIIGCIVLSSAVVCISDNAPLANENKFGLYAKSIEQVLRLEPEQIDIGTAVLIVSEQWSDAVAGRQCQRQLDEIAHEIRDRLQAKKIKADARAIEVINQYLFEEQGFSSVKEADDPNDLFLHSVLKNKRGYCLSLSVLYLAIGERLGLPLYGVVVPGHFFVRYDDGRERFNIETTSKGGYATDESYIKKFKVPSETADGIYMKNLNALQTLGCFFNNLGNSYMEVGNKKQAQAALERAVGINPGLAESRTNLGNIYLQDEKVDEAIRQYRAALQISPDDAKVRNNIGNAYFKKGWLNEATTEYERAIKLDPNLTDAYKNAATIYCQQKQYGRAEQRLRTAIEIEPKNAGLYLQLGQVYRERGEFNRAIAELRNALNLKPNYAEAYFNLALCFKGLEQTDSEIEAYKNALSAKPDMAEAMINLGNTYFGRKQYDEAIELYQRAVPLRPNESTVYYNIGAAYSNKGEQKKAVEAYLKAVEIDPKFGDAHYGLAYSYYNLQDYSSALKHLETARVLGVKIDAELASAIKKRLK
jgi:tetratricopeptide (TPR) repeat protein